MFSRIFDKLRRPDKNKKNPLSYVLFAAIFAMIIVAFVFMDPGMMGGGGMYGNSTAVKVGSAVVPTSVYRRHVQAIEQRMSFLLNSGNEQMLAGFRRRMQQQAINEIVNKEILAELQSSEGLVVPDRTVSSFILNIDFLKENGRFQRSRYENFLANSGLSPERFEEDLRKDLRFELLRELFNQSYKMTDLEKTMDQQAKDLQLQFEYVSLSQEHLKNQLEISSSEAQKFLAEAEDQVLKEYEGNASKYTQPEKVKAKFLMILAENGSETAFVEAKEKLDEISKDLTLENFAAKAKEHSDDPTAAQGGDLGYVEKGTYTPEWDEAAFTTKVGEISKPLKLGAGWAKILIEEKVPSKKQDFEVVKLDIATELTLEKKAKDIVDQIREFAKASDKEGIEQVLKTNSLEWESTPNLPLTTASIPEIGVSEKMITTVLNLKKQGDIASQLIPVDGRNYLVRKGKVQIKEQAPQQPEMIEGRRVDYALGQWLEQKRGLFNIEISPLIQEEWANN